MIRSQLSQITITILAVSLIALTGWLVAAGQGLASDPRGGIAQVAEKAVTPRVTDDQAKPSTLARDLVGTWVLVGTPDKIGEAPATGGMLKFFTGKHWAITQADPKTNEVVFHHGGTYQLDGDQYTETVEYANANTAELIKKTHRFKIKVEGDTYTQIGIDNEWSQVWKCAK